jgi:predicted ATPase
VLVTRPGGYVFRLEPHQLDLTRFERLVSDGSAAAAAGAPEVAAAKLTEALSLWRGRPLADIEYEPSAAEPVIRLAELRLEALEERLESELLLGGELDLVAELESLTSAYPLRERFRRHLMLALYRAGRQADALEVYRETRRLLVAELGVEPGPALQAVNRAILVQDESLGPRPPEPVGAPAVPERPETGVRTTPFVGRVRERRALARLLRAPETRLVTLVGPGGAGKTRLAQELGRELGTGFRHGAVVVDLVPVADPDLLATGIAGTLGLQESLGRDPVESLVAFLRGRDMLLILDNFEHLLEAAKFVPALLARAPGPTLVVTSRAPLRVSGEHVFPVPPLELPDLAGPLTPEGVRRLDAVRLFVQRAQRARRDFELTAGNAQAVSELCVRLDGLPLALELAAARVRLLSPRAIVDRLGLRLDLLRDEAPDTAERHRSLRAAIEWSYELLDDEEQQLFACLGVFSGSFTLDAAEVVAGTHGLDAIETVESLLDNSLLRSLPTAGEEPRFGMLETIREYAVERLAARADEDDVRRRHAVHYLGIAEKAEPELRGPAQLLWLERLDADNDNLRAALDWAVVNEELELGLRGGAGLWRFWQTRSQNGEGRERLERLLALDPRDVDATVVATGVAAAGRLAFIMGDYATARCRLNDSLPAHRRVGAVPWAPMTLGVLALIALAYGEDEATPLVEESVELARGSRDWWVQSVNLSALAEVLRARSEFGKARLALEEGLRAARECGDIRNIGRILSVLGLVALAQDDHERARRLFEEALEVQRECRDTWNISRTLANLGLVAQARGDREEATRGVGKALVMQAESNDRDGVGTSLQLLAELAADAGRASRAVCLASAALVLREEAAAFPMNRLQRAGVDVDALRAQLDEEAFEEAWSGGRSMMLDEVVRYALEEGAGQPEVVRPRLPRAARE